MSLSQREQMILRGIADELARQDPGLPARLARIEAPRRWRPPAAPAALLALALGFALMVCGATAAAPPVGWAGVAVAVAASCWLLVVVTQRLHGRRTG